MRLLLAVLILPACSETGLNQRTRSDDPDACLDAPLPYSPPSTEPCEGEPIIGSFEPVVKWRWDANAAHPGYHQVMAAPVVAHLDGDGIPDVVTSTFGPPGYHNAGALVAIDGADGSLKWSVTRIGGALPYGSSGVAIADLGDGAPVVLVVTDQGLAAVEGRDGSVRWVSDVPRTPYSHPSVADIDGDGVAEIVLGASVIDADGSLRWTGTGGTGGARHGSFAADLDEDGVAEIVAGNTVYEADGTIRWMEGVDGWPAVGDFDADGSPEIVTVLNGAVVLRDAHGVEVWTVALPDGGGGPPTVADFDGDRLPEIGVASRSVYRVLDGDGSVLWENVVQDYSSSRTGSSVFDFEGDGAAEVVYADEETLFIWDGATGAEELRWDEHSSGTLFEYPLIVDVDADGAAEIVVASNDYSQHKGSRGITVIEDAADSWAAARQVWNQHAWSITNADDQGRAPAGAPGNWRRWNSFRAGNSETAVGLGMPDLTLGDPDVCDLRCEAVGTVELWLPLENRGKGASGPAWVSVSRGPDAPERIALLRSEGVAANDVEWLGPVTVSAELLVDLAGDGLYVQVDDDEEVEECREADNARWISEFACVE